MITLTKTKQIFKITILIIIFLIIATPILVFISKFDDFEISKNMTDWGALGSYIGGITGSIISLFNLIILAYITYIVGKNSIKENKNLFVFKMRMEAYDELMKFALKLNSIPINSAKQRFKQRFDEIKGEVTPEYYYEQYSSILKVLDFVPDFHYFIFNFNARYNHIFHFDFKSKIYKDLLQSSESLNNSILSLYDDFGSGKSTTGEKINFNTEIFSEMHKHLVDFVNELKKELE